MSKSKRAKDVVSGSRASSAKTSRRRSVTVADTSRGLVIELRDGHNVPIFVCEGCGEQIEDLSMCAVVWKWIQKEGDRCRAIVLCKKNGCLSAEPYKAMQWQDWPKSLMWLLFNSGMNTEEKLLRAFADAERWYAVMP